MLHTAQANWSPSGEGFARPGARLQAQTPVIRVSALSSAALVEQPAANEMVAMTTQPSLRVPSSDAPQEAIYGSDMVIMAMGLVGAWMILVGIAMLARRMRLIRLEQTHI